MPRKHIKTRYPGVFYRVGRNGDRQYEITFRDETGKQRWKRTPGDLQAAAAALAEIKAKRRRGLPVRPAERTLQEVYEEWAPIYLPRLRRSTRTAYERSMRNYVLPTFGQQKVQRIDAVALAQWITGLERGTYAVPAGAKRRGSKSKARTPQPLKAWTIRAALTPLRRVLTYAVRQRLIPENPVLHLGRDEMPSSDQRERRILTIDELQAVFAQASERYRLPLQVLAFTGLRAKELLGLVWSDVDLKDGAMHVRKQLGEDEKGMPARVDPKTPESVRTVYLMPPLVKALKARKLAALPGREWVFPMDDGSPGTYPGLEAAFKYAVKKAGVGEPRPTLHSLRHGFGSMLAKETGDTAFVSKRMGHANPAITARIYMHELESKETARRSIESMTRTFGHVLEDAGG